MQESTNFVSPCLRYDILEGLDWPEDIFIEGGILSRGDTMLIASESKAGKSTFIGGMIRQIITGGSFLGFKVTRPLKIIYMQAELRENRLKERLAPTYKDLPTKHKNNLFIWSTRGIILFKTHKEEIEKTISDIRPDLLIIDPMLNFHNYNENNAQEMAEFFRYLDKIKETYDMAIIMAHHFKKPPTDSKYKCSLLDSIRGSSALRGWAVTTIAMEGRGQTEYRELAFDMRNSDEPLKRIIKYNKLTKDFDWHDPVAIIGTWLQTHLPKPITSMEFSSLIKLNHGTLLSNNHDKINNLKKVLLDSHFIKEEIIGKKHLISLY